MSNSDTGMDDATRRWWEERVAKEAAEKDAQLKTYNPPPSEYARTIYDHIYNQLTQPSHIDGVAIDKQQAPIDRDTTSYYIFSDEHHADYVGFINSNGDVYRAFDNTKVGIAEANGNIYNLLSLGKIIGNVTDKGVVCAPDDKNEPIAIIKDNGKIYTHDQQSAVVGVVEPPNAIAGGAAFLLLLKAGEKYRFAQQISSTRSKPVPDDQMTIMWCPDCEIERTRSIFCPECNAKLIPITARQTKPQSIMQPKTASQMTESTPSPPASGCFLSFIYAIVTTASLGSIVIIIIGAVISFALQSLGQNPWRNAGFIMNSTIILYLLFFVAIWRAIYNHMNGG